MTQTPGAPPSLTLLRITHGIYALHALSILLAILGDSLIVARFVFGLPSLVAVLLNYAFRHQAIGTPLAVHFRWQIRTFWFAALWFFASTLILGPLLLIYIGGPLLLVAYVATGIWTAYRIARGWLALGNHRGP